MQSFAESTRHITTVSESEKLLRNFFEDGERNENTVSQYCKHVIHLYQGLMRQKDFSTLKWIENADAIIN
jgi:hypothetical protein